MLRQDSRRSAVPFEIVAAPMHTQVTETVSAGGPTVTDVDVVDGQPLRVRGGAARKAPSMVVQSMRSVRGYIK